MNPARDRTVLHVDMDAFYAAVEQRDRPELRGRPVVVGGDVRGVVAAASYEARQFGIRSAMPMREAERRCRELVRLPVRMEYYKAISDEVFGIFREYTPLVEGLSLDEAYLDATDSLALFVSGDSIASSIKQRIRQQTGLTASVGVAPNKLLAKIASELEKPDGLVVVMPAHAREFLDPLPVQVIPGVGPETRRRLNRAGIRCIRELRDADDSVLEPIFGRYTRRASERAAGFDDRPVVPLREEKSLSAEQTFANDLTSRPEMHRELLRLCERTCGRLRRAGLAAGTVQLKIRQNDFSTFMRQRALKPPGNSTDGVFGVARKLLDQWLEDHPHAAVRLLGVGGSELSSTVQADLFGSAANLHGRDNARLDRTVDEIRERFGNSAVGRARVLGPRQFR